MVLGFRSHSSKEKGEIGDLLLILTPQLHQPPIAVEVKRLWLIAESPSDKSQVVRAMGHQL
jgi:hypothetical protein